VQRRERLHTFVLESLEADDPLHPSLEWSDPSSSCATEPYPRNHSTVKAGNRWQALLLE